MSEYDTDRRPALERIPGRPASPRAAGELVNETELDWSDIAEEIESVGETLPWGAYDPAFLRFTQVNTRVKMSIFTHSTSRWN